MFTKTTTYSTVKRVLNTIIGILVALTFPQTLPQTKTTTYSLEIVKSEYRSIVCAGGRQRFV